MAKTTRVVSDIDRDLRSVQAIVNEATEYLDEWTGLAVSDREAWAVEWEYAIVGLVPALQSEY